MVFDPEELGVGKEINRIVEVSQGDTATFYMDSSQTELDRNVELSGSPSSSQLVDIVNQVTSSCQFANPVASAQGLGINSSGCLWHSDFANDSVYKLDHQGNINNKKGLSNPTGVAVDKNDDLWLSNGSDSVYFVYPDFPDTSAIPQFATPGAGPQGLDLDSNSCIWLAEIFAESIYQLNQYGSVESQISSPGASPIGVALDSNDCIWNSDSGSACIYKLDQSGNIETQFNTPGSSGVTVDDNSCLWVANTDSIYKLDQTGSVITSSSIVSRVSSRSASTVTLDSDLSGSTLSFTVLDSNVESADIQFKKEASNAPPGGIQ